MDAHERMEFRLFCEQATDSQLEAIFEKESEASEGSDYRALCAEIAEAEMRRRGLS